MWVVLTIWTFYSIEKVHILSKGREINNGIIYLLEHINY